MRETYHEITLQRWTRVRSHGILQTMETSLVIFHGGDGFIDCAQFGHYIVVFHETPGTVDTQYNDCRKTAHFFNNKLQSRVSVPKEREQSCYIKKQ